MEGIKIAFLNVKITVRGLVNFIRFEKKSGTKFSEPRFFFILFLFSFLLLIYFSIVIFYFWWGISTKKDKYTNLLPRARSAVIKIKIKNGAT